MLQAIENTDLFATKGAEYLAVIGYLLVLAAFWRLLWVPRAVPSRAQAAGRASRTGEWFRLPETLYFHQGHAWARPVDGGTMQLGMDDFAQKLLGRASGVSFPKVGDRLSQGEAGWRVQVDGHAIAMLSPVDGEVVEVNQSVASAPELVNSDPYDRGWLVKVKVANPHAARANLLSGALARDWMNGVVERLRSMPGGAMGIVMPDGGFPVDGFARALSAEAWDEVARRFLLIEE